MHLSLCLSCSSVCLLLSIHVHEKDGYPELSLSSSSSCFFLFILQSICIHGDLPTSMCLPCFLVQSCLFLLWHLLLLSLIFFLLFTILNLLFYCAYFSSLALCVYVYIYLLCRSEERFFTFSLERIRWGTNISCA